MKNWSSEKLPTKELWICYKLLLRENERDETWTRKRRKETLTDMERERESYQIIEKSEKGKIFRLRSGKNDQSHSCQITHLPDSSYVGQKWPLNSKIVKFNQILLKFMTLLSSKPLRCPKRLNERYERERMRDRWNMNKKEKGRNPNPQRERERERERERKGAI